ncbi:MAG: type IV pilus secretin PilQ [Neisseriaceae bacterium]|nr:type IV pilus secretin PilQ [Neisseriaceae bacterium]
MRRLIALTLLLTAPLWPSMAKAVVPNVQTPITLHFEAVALPAALTALAQVANVPLIVAEDVAGTVTASLNQIPWQQAMQQLLHHHRLSATLQAGTLYVASQTAVPASPPTPIAPLLSSAIFQLNYKDVSELATIFHLNSSDKTARHLLSPNGQAYVDPGNNVLIVHDTAAVHADVRRLIAQLDRPKRQVLIEAHIVEANDGFAHELGLKLGAAFQNNRLHIGGPWPTEAANTTTMPFHLAPSLNLSGPSDQAALSVFGRGANLLLGLELSAMQLENKGKVLSSPRLLTADRQTATIESGDELPYREAESYISTTRFKKAVLSLKVTPYITPDDQVIMAIAISKDTPKGNGALSIKSINTQVMIEDGSTLVIGGIYEESHSEAQRKVPLLGDLPLLGPLFRTRQQQQNRQELVIFLTPNILVDKIPTATQ